MNIDVNTFKPRRERVSPHVSYGLTQLGKVEVEESGFQSGVLWDVLGYLDDHGPSKMSQIAKDMEQSRERIKIVLTRAIKQGYVRPVTGE